MLRTEGLQLIFHENLVSFLNSIKVNQNQVRATKRDNILLKVRIDHKEF